jgi:alcohol dehydrogenase class IV
MISSVYSLQTPRKILAGVKSVQQLAQIAGQLNASRGTLITDAGVFKAGLADIPKTIMEKAGMTVTVIDCVNPEPEMSHVMALFEDIKKSDSQMLVAVGGGSVMDVAKLLAALITNPEFADNILDAGRVTRRGIPTVMIPTTAGTGSEATPNAIVVVPEKELKIGILSEHFIPDYVILDPELTVRLPKIITAATGIDAFCHAIECFTSKIANPLSDALALRAIRLISENLRQAYREGADIEARHNMMLAAFFGGLCISTSGTTAVHALAYPLGGKYRIAHGISNAMLLPYVMEFNLDAAVDRFQDVAAAMDVGMAGKSRKQVAEGVIEAIHSLVRDVEISCDLKPYGVTESDVDGMADAAMQVTRLLNNNPRPVTKDDAAAIYRKLL